jgi:hypothetical protein
VCRLTSAPTDDIGLGLDTVVLHHAGRLTNPGNVRSTALTWQIAVGGAS